MNLKKETLKELADNGKSWSDILGVCGNDFQIDKELFLKLADREYNDGYGGEEVACDLKIVGNDFWLERHSYDGSEWWEFKSLPDLSNMKFEKVERVIRESDYWHTGSLKSLQSKDLW